MQVMISLNGLLATVFTGPFPHHKYNNHFFTSDSTHNVIQFITKFIVSTKTHIKVNSYSSALSPDGQSEHIKDSQPMISYKLVSHCKPLGPIISEL